MTQAQLDYPRDISNQVQYLGDATDVAGINQRLRRLYDAHNNIPGTTEWLYVGKDVPWLNSWHNWRDDVPQSFCATRFRRFGYDVVEIEGMARNLLAPPQTNMWQMPDGFIPQNSKRVVIWTNAPVAIGTLDIVGLEVGANVGMVQCGSNSIGQVALDNIRYSLIPSKY